MKLLIRNLARTVTDVKLREIFEAYGTVQSCTLVMDKETGDSKGFGFVEMPKPGEAKAAAINLNGKEIERNQIRVKKAEKKAGEKTEKKTEDKTEVIVEKKAEVVIENKAEVIMKKKTEENVVKKAKINPWKK
jgi:RNA recognition motif-containing protein